MCAGAAEKPEQSKMTLENRQLCGSLSSQTKFNQNHMKNTQVEKNRYKIVLVDQLGRPKNSRSWMMVSSFRT